MAELGFFLFNELFFCFSFSYLTRSQMDCGRFISIFILFCSFLAVLLALTVADHHGPPKVNFWEDPMHPSKWKQEHVSFIIICFRRHLYNVVVRSLLRLF